MAAKKNSLVGNINRRKKSGTSRPKSRSTVDAAAYEAMERGWPKKSAKKRGKKKAATKPARSPRASGKAATKKAGKKARKTTKRAASRG